MSAPTVDLVAQQQGALALIDLGLHLFTVDHPDLDECAGRHAPDRPCDGQRGKHPEPWSWARGSTDVALTVARMFGRGPRNVGVDCGRSGLVVLDEDAPGELDRACTDLGVALPATFTVSTGKGQHVYLRQPDGVPWGNARGRLGAYAVDVRGRGGYVVGPGSVHASGREYRIADPSPIADAPEWLGAVLAPPARRPARPRARPVTRGGLAGVLRVVLNAREGNRNAALYWSSLRLFERVRDGQVDEEAARSMLLDAAHTTGLGDGESRATVESARRKVFGSDD